MMTMPAEQSTTQASMCILSRLLLAGPRNDSAQNAQAVPEVCEMSREEFDELVHLADLNHVIIRGLKVFREMAAARRDLVRIEWAETAMAAEHARIQNAIKYLHDICSALEIERHDVTVIKSLDHWPDRGSDLDLYTDADPREIVELMESTFGAELAPRSWGDRLANKWNFLIPGLPEAVEIHMGRLGQTGEHVAMASRLMKRTRVISVDEHQFRVPSASDRIMISTLQRMYRHFYFRLCDIVDSAQLLESGIVDFTRLIALSESPGIWKGVATYLVLVSDYVKRFRGTEVPLPSSVRAAATFGGEKLT